MLNAMTVEEQVPIGRSSQSWITSSGVPSTSQIGMSDGGFNNVRMKEGNEWKAASGLTVDLFEPLVMFFGLTNSPRDFPNDDG